jgi:hypothetical protein
MADGHDVPVTNYRVGVDEGGTIPFIRRYVIMLP